MRQSLLIHCGMLKEMEESPSSALLEGKITGIRFGLATRTEICTSSNSDCPINHASQLSNPFLGLPLESGKCESCGTAEPGKCEGHFGYIELPIPIYHPCHVSELKRMLSLLCLKCLKMKNRKVKNIGLFERSLASCCEEAPQVSIDEVKTTDGACSLKLKLPSRSRLREGCWNFLERYGFRYGDDFCRTLLAYEEASKEKRRQHLLRSLLGRNRRVKLWHRVNGIGGYMKVEFDTEKARQSLYLLEEEKGGWLLMVKAFRLMGLSKPRKGKPMKGLPKVARVGQWSTTTDQCGRMFGLYHDCVRNEDRFDYFQSYLVGSGI
ncbi:hypothetical protein F0562_013352 [Nyssa sinensis]|uniref:DNA-directed RNA polymerase n=1 Tax=Nyssa sinensis TaxID=561372 RepID=A0A5J4ZN38_9ASTE|nr:hypothetical protein F0562_013352 [Nyssa sinensis]